MRCRILSEADRPVSNSRLINSRILRNSCRSPRCTVVMVTMNRLMSLVPMSAID